MKDRLDKLLSVKSIVTIMLSFVFAFLSLKRDISSEQFLTVFTVVISFYFGVQANKDKK